MSGPTSANTTAPLPRVPLQEASELGQHILGTDPPQPIETAEYRLNHVMLRISNPERSLSFYREGLGLRTIFTFNTGAWTIYYLGHSPHPTNPASYPALSTLGTQRGLLELYHFHPPHQPAPNPSHPNSSPFHSGNHPSSLGFGHIGFTVPDVAAAIDRILKFCPDTKIVKPLGEAKVENMGIPESIKDEEIEEGYKHVFRQLAFLEDPDGYWVELVPTLVKS